MDTGHFGALTRTLPAAGSRRRGLVAALGGSLAALGLRDTGAKNKRKKKKKTRCTCPPPPTLPPAPFCAGKNTCAQGAEVRCEVAGASDRCYCWVRQDNATPFCGTETQTGSSCSICTENEVCVIFGGSALRPALPVSLPA